MTMRKITWQGMRGRKRDTRLLCLVVALSFAFILCASILLSSMTHTEREQRRKVYGRWQVMFYGAQESDAAAFAEAGGEHAAVSALVGETDQAGLVASIDPRLAEMGSFEMAGGRLPEAPGEIALVRGEGAQQSVSYTHLDVYKRQAWSITPCG